MTFGLVLPGGVLAFDHARGETATYPTRRRARCALHHHVPTWLRGLAAIVPLERVEAARAEGLVPSRFGEGRPANDVTPPPSRTLSPELDAWIATHPAACGFSPALGSR